MVRGAYGVNQVDDAGWTAGSHRGNPTSERGRAVRQLATLARDAVDAAMLLDVLGLTAAEGKEQR